ncbi:cytochrome c biogenesis protein CCS1, chloroplastic-like isoform X2 [Solanum dulcamara]|uniref:cytochrome c biogenesis protein CCS1, chloroplastic-like isoform X2 n=1 Tax=Solanum dulcamara TaxID=45834 RepID=UPI0024851FC3|nr:cytochrome c biogenesis protein CCS1, chloroplastic-like isoform X2 [Solanum dulcamara]
METLKFSIKPHFQNHFCVPQNSRIGVYNEKGRTFSFTLTCKFKTSKGKKISKKKKISWPDYDGAPPLLERKKAEEATTRNNGLKTKRVLLGGLLNLPLAIGSSIIDQSEVPEFVFQNFPEDHPLFCFFSWKWITLSLDHMFSSPIFLGTLALLGASLMASTYTTQTPLVKVARRRSFSNSAEAIHKKDDVDTLPRASVEDTGVTLMGAGYEVFLKGPALHALKGLADRIVSIGVHLALLLVMSGGTLDAASSLGEDVTVPQGLNSVVEDVLTPSGILSSSSDASHTEYHVNRFYVDYDESGEVSQFHTDISLFDLNGKEVLRKTIRTGVRGPNSKLPIEIDGSKTVIADAIGSRDLDLKIDSEAPIVYAGFGSLMLSTCISYLSHAQLSTLQEGITEVVRGKTNRAKSESLDTVDRSLDQTPEVFESSCTEESDSFIGIRIQVGIWNKKHQKRV